MVTVSRDVENNDNNSILDIACKIELIMIKLKIGIFLLTFCKKYIYMYDSLLVSFLLIMLFNIKVICFVTIQLTNPCH